MIKLLTLITSILLLSGCLSVPAGLPNNFQSLTVKMQNGDEKNIIDTGWYKARKKVFETGAYKFAMNATSNGGFFSLNTPTYCPGITGTLGSFLIATEENKKQNEVLINKIGQNLNSKFNKWLEMYSPELVNACNTKKILQSEVKLNSGVYTHYLRSFDDDALSIESFNLFFLMEQGKEKILTIISADKENSALYTLKGEKLCSIDKSATNPIDLSIEGLIKLLESPDKNKTIAVTCIGDRKATMNLNKMKLSSVLSIPEGVIVINFDDKSSYNLRFVQFTDDPTILK